MHDAATEATLRSLIAEVQHKMVEATGIAKAALICADNGNAVHALQILMDFEGLAHDAQDLFKAALPIRHHLLSESS